MLGAATVRWSSKFHLLITLLEKTFGNIPGALSLKQPARVLYTTPWQLLDNKWIQEWNTGRHTLSLYVDVYSSILCGRVFVALKLRVSGDWRTFAWRNCVINRSTAVIVFSSSPPCRIAAATHRSSVAIADGWNEEDEQNAVGETLSAVTDTLYAT